MNFAIKTKYGVSLHKTLKLALKLCEELTRLGVNDITIFKLKQGIALKYKKESKNMKVSWK